MTGAQRILGGSDSNIADIIDAASNALIQTVASELQRLGIYGGLGDDGDLRHVIREMILRRLGEPQNAHLTGPKVSVSAPNNGDQRGQK